MWLALGLASLPLRAPEFRAWERVYDSETRRFAPNRRLEMQVIGDLGFKAWVRELQHPRPTVFSTDRFGFRNPDSGEPPRIVVIGDSYVAGAGLPDSATLAAQLSELLEERVYGFATQYLNGPALFFREERFAKHPPDVVVWAPVARAIRPRPLFVRNLGESGGGALERFADVGEELSSLVRRGNEGNRLTRELRFLQQGWLYARRGHPHARRLPGGELVLALS
ncbi:MAG: hypothetical protein HKP27_05125, partial [Myxococcales bacterium]|nr:hypothetical protein [Myxococcales bacterium]